LLTVRTDLAIEARELVDKDYPKEIPGMEIDKDEYDGIKITRVKIRTKEAEEIMGKPIGNYISIEVPRLREKDIELQERVSKNFANEMKNIADLSSNTTTMVIGLGNWNITPDSLGPKTVEKLFITRHMIDKLEGENEEKRFGSLCAFSPGVLGITGIESAEVIHGIVEKIKPDLVIAIDALAARDMSRVSTTIQISNTGIHPGSGVGNRRMAITEESLGVPVIAVGIPTVVDAPTMANDTIDMLLDTLIAQTDEGSPFYNLLKQTDKGEKYKLIKEVSSPFIGNLMVTPTGIDTIVEDLSRVLAGGLNTSLHPGITLDEVSQYLQ